MFHPSADRPLPEESALHGLRASLNSPVLKIDELPDGAARAAILLYADGPGTLRLAVGVRSMESGKVAVFTHRGAVKEGRSRAAMEAALVFAESMGFLFDDDLMEQSGDNARTRAHQQWCALIHGEDAEAEAPVVDALLEPLDREDDADSFLDSLEAETRPPLTKFRQAPQEPEAAPPETQADNGGSSELGRISLVKRRESVEKPGFLMRLLGQF